MLRPFFFFMQTHLPIDGLPHVASVNVRSTVRYWSYLHLETFLLHRRVHLKMEVVKPTPLYGGASFYVAGYVCPTDSRFR